MKEKPMEKMRVSFDLDEVSFVSPDLCKTEPELHFPWNRIYKERLRLGTPELINSLQNIGTVFDILDRFRFLLYIGLILYLLFNLSESLGCFSIGNRKSYNLTTGFFKRKNLFYILFDILSREIAH